VQLCLTAAGIHWKIPIAMSHNIPQAGTGVITRVKNDHRRLGSDQFIFEVRLTVHP